MSPFRHLETTRELALWGLQVGLTTSTLATVGMPYLILRRVLSACRASTRPSG